MTAWQDDALCQNNPGAFDFNSKLLRLRPDAYIKAAGTCLSCPVRVQCERWADAETRDNDGKGDLGFIAAGYTYSRRGEHGKKLLARACVGCGGVINAQVTAARYCSNSCRGWGAA